MPTPYPAAPYPFPLGGIYLDHERFTTDPKTYKPLQWMKRYNISAAIGGKVTIQDFGVVAKDCEIELASDEKQFLDELTVISYHTKWRTRGATYNFRDWMRNEFTVFLTDFIPVNFKPNIYLYTMKCRVVGITALWGVTYTGT